VYKKERKEKSSRENKSSANTVKCILLPVSGRYALGNYIIILI